MISLRELVCDDKGVFRIKGTDTIVSPEKIGEPKEVKIHKSYGEYLIVNQIWRLRQANFPYANGYIPENFTDIVEDEYKTARVQFYKY